MPYAHVNGLRLHYEISGAGASTLVFLHGLGSSADDWSWQLPALAPHFRCVVLDLRGHGQSDKTPDPYSIDLFAADVAALLRELNIDRPHVLGLSLGGLVAQALAIQDPQVARSLILINTFPGLWPPAMALLGPGLQRLSGLVRRPRMTETADQVARQLFPEPEQETLRTGAATRLAQNDPDAYRATFRAVLRFRPTAAALRTVTCPALIVAGERDTVVPLVYKQRLSRLLPNARLVVIPGSGHASTIDAAETVNRAVLNFLLPFDAH
jgi:3-oxoadipate enol-lactonase